MVNSFFRYFLFLLLLLTTFQNVNGQGRNHNWLLGYTSGLDTNVISKRSILAFTDTSISISPTNFPMAFRGAQGNISDENGNLLIYTNGCYIADSSNNVMSNGDSLNPGYFSDSWCSATSGLPLTNTAVFLPWPGDSSKYVLFHQTSTDTNYTVSSQLYYSTIDLSLNGGLGAVIQKNVVAIQTALCPAIGVCKHANGRDWWIVTMSPYSDTIYKLLLTPNGIINYPPQPTGLPLPNNFTGNLQFSPDGTKFAYYHNYFIGSTRYHQLRKLDFDRCNGIFSNPDSVTSISSTGGYSLAFSPNSRYIYYCNFDIIFQVDCDSLNLASTVKTVAIYDNYSYPYSFMQTDFWYEYLAANGKIYITSGNSTIDLHVIANPDSAGLSCNVLQHSLRVPCYSFRGNVYHPNYYLGPVIGSVCDSLAHVGLQEHLEEVQNFQISPNPISNAEIKITYLLPQNKSGVFEVYDTNGKIIYSQILPEWSSLQFIHLPFLNNGLYYTSITSGNSRMVKKLVVLK